MENGNIILSIVRSSKNIRSILLLSHVVAIIRKIIIRKPVVRQKTKIKIVVNVQSPPPVIKMTGKG